MLNAKLRTSTTISCIQGDINDLCSKYSKIYSPHVRRILVAARPSFTRNVNEDEGVPHVIRFWEKSFAEYQFWYCIANSCATTDRLGPGLTVTQHAI